MFVSVAHASVDTFVASVNEQIINPLIWFIFALALVIFVQGIVKYFTQADNDEQRSKGRQHIMWGIVGMVIMFSVFLIMKIILSTLGVSQDNINISGSGQNVNVEVNLDGN